MEALRSIIVDDFSLQRRWEENAAAQRALFAEYKLDPAHTIELVSHEGVAKILWQGNTIAESRNAVKLLERKHDAVFYFPPEDVRTDLMERNDHATHCPYKGDASYWTLQDGARNAENSVWAYESPIEAVAGIKGMMAFYLDSMGKDFGLIQEID